MPVWDWILIGIAVFLMVLLFATIPGSWKRDAEIDKMLAEWKNERGEREQ